MNGRIKQLLKLLPSFLLIVAILVVSVIPVKKAGASVKLSGGNWATLDGCRPVDMDYSKIRAITDKKEQTILIYIIGSNLESEDASASVDILEMLNSDIDVDKCNVVLFTGGAYEWHNGISADSNGIYFLAGKGEDRGFYTAFETDGLLDTADPSTLSFFLNAAYYLFPAQQYNLILWDHGGGILGYGPDEITRHVMGLKGISGALENSPFKKIPLGWIAFDACLMATVEVATAVKDYADYLLASEEVMTSLGLNYLSFGKVTNQIVGGVKASKLIAEDAYKAIQDASANGAKKAKIPFTFSCIDLGKIDAVQKAMNALFQKCNNRFSASYSSYCAFISNLMEFGDNQSSGMVDFKEYAAFWNKFFSKEAKALTGAIQAAVLYNKSTYADANGMTIYTVKPKNERVSFQYAKKAYDALLISKQYTKYMNAFIDAYNAGGSVNWAGSDQSGATTSQKTSTTKITTTTTTQKTTTTTNTTAESRATAASTSTVTTQKPTAYTVERFSLTQQQNRLTTQPLPSFTVPAFSLSSNNTGNKSGQNVSTTDITDFVYRKGSNMDTLITAANGNSMKLTLSDEQINSVAVVKKVLVEKSGDAYCVRTISNDVHVDGNEISAAFDRNVYYLKSGGSRIPLYLYEVQKTSERTICEANVSVCRTAKFSWLSSTACALRIVFDKDNPEGYVEGLRFLKAEYYSAPIELKDGYVIRSTYFGYKGLDRDWNGKIAPFVVQDDTGYFHSFDLVIKEYAEVEFAPNEDKELFGCIYIQDIGGYSFYTDFIKVEE